MLFSWTARGAGASGQLFQEWVPSWTWGFQLLWLRQNIPVKIQQYQLLMNNSCSFFFVPGDTLSLFTRLERRSVGLCWIWKCWAAHRYGFALFPIHLEKLGRLLSSLSGGIVNRASGLVWWSLRSTFGASCPKAAGRERSHPPALCSLFEISAVAPSSSLQPYGFERRGAAAHLPSSLCKRWWELYYQQSAYRQQIHRRLGWASRSHCLWLTVEPP